MLILLKSVILCFRQGLSLSSDSTVVYYYNIVYFQNQGLSVRTQNYIFRNRNPVRGGYFFSAQECSKNFVYVSRSATFSYALNKAVYRKITVTLPH